MYSKEASKQLRIDFWTAFGVYMRQHVPLVGHKQKWVNYHTGVKDVFFRLEADRNHVQVAISLEHPDPGMRALFYAQFEELQTYMAVETALEWTWSPDRILADGRRVAMIARRQEGWSLYRREDWGDMFRYLEEGITALDRLWADCNEVFKDLAE